MTKETTVAFRVSDDFKKKLQKEADKNYRSLSQEMVMRLEKSFKSEKK